MKHPKKDDFETETSDASVVATFMPTNSEYTFTRPADAADISKFGPVSLEPTVWHPAGDTGDYSAAEVQRMALSVAQEAARHHRPD